MRMKLAIIGSRGIDEKKALEIIEQVIKKATKTITEIISGGAKGADTTAKNYAKANGIKLTEYLPNYKEYGRGAPLKRNETIIKNSDAVLAIWDGESRGTQHAIRKAKAQGMPTLIIKI